MVEWTPARDSADGSDIQVTHVNGFKLVVYEEGGSWYYTTHYSMTDFETHQGDSEEDAKRQAIAAALAQS